MSAAERLLDQALALKPEERLAFAAEACHGAALHDELVSLIEDAEAADKFFDRLTHAVFSSSFSAGGEEHSRMPADPELRIGDVIGRYRILALAGRGGMGTVYRARDTELDRDVALKFLPADLGAQRDSGERLMEEARAAAALDHSNICTIHEIGQTDDGRRFIAMAYYDGETLKERLARGRMSPEECVATAVQIARALAAAHARGIIHRDVKPGNVMLGSDGTVRLLDFGLATAADGTRLGSGLTHGTIAYMSPEQVRGDLLDARTDLWSLGVVLYEMLTGERPFHGADSAAVLRAILHEQPEPMAKRRIGAPPSLTRITEKLLRKEPSARYSNANDVATDLIRARSISSSRKRIAIVAAAAIAALAAGAIVAVNRSDTRPAEIRLAVLPFENLGAAADEYLADGVAEEIGHKLAGVPGLMVIGRRSTAHLKRTGATPTHIGRQLDADFILDGSVRWARTSRGENVVRVIPQLVRVSNSAQVWGEPYEGTLAQVFALQHAIAEEVTDAVRLRLMPATRTALRRPITSSVGAYEKYLLGRHLWKQRGPALVRAAQHFEEAVALDPNFARAYSGLADAYALMAGFGIGTLSRSEARERAKRAARRAVQLDSTIAESWASVGLVLLNEDIRGAYDAYRRAIALDPGYASAQQWYGELLSHIGRYDEAIEWGEKAVALDPFVPVAHSVLTNPYAALGKYGAAEQAAERALTIDPHSQPALLQAARIAIEQGKVAETRRLLERLGIRAPHAIALTTRPRTDRERERVREAAAAAASLNGFHRALYLAWLGEHDAALDFLARSVADGEPFRNVRSVRAFEGLRGDPRFERLIDQMGLSDTKLREAGLLRR